MNKKYIPYIAILVLVIIIAVMAITRPENVSSVIQDARDSIVTLESQAIDQQIKYDILESEIDSSFDILEDKPEIDQKQIHIKHETNRDNIILLTDSQSVMLLSSNIKGE